MRSSEAASRAREELGWELVRYQLDGLLEKGLERLGAPEPSPRPKELHVEVTHRCNLKCVMCEHWQIEHIDPESVERELDFARLRASIEGSTLLDGIEVVVVTGGEPWLRHDLTDILVWLADRFPRAKLIVLTNFWNTGHLRLKLNELKARGLFPEGQPPRLSLGSSLDGLPATHDLVRGQPGAFDGLARTVKALRAEFPGLHFGFTFTMVPQNAHELWDCYRLVQEELGSGMGAQWAVQTDGIEPLRWTPEQRKAGLEGVRRIAMDLCAKHGAVERLKPESRTDSAWLWSELLYWRYLEEYGRQERRFSFFKRCTAGERHVMVGAEGEVFFCPVNRARTIGNLKEQALDAMWTGPQAAAVREFVDSGQCHCWLRCVSTPAVDRLLGLALSDPPAP